MELRECYEKLEGNYEEAVGRLMNERLVQKFLLKFLDDKSMELLLSSVEAGNWEEAFRAAHTMKGVAGNLAFTRLGVSSTQLTDVLRGGNPADPALLQRVQEDYELTASAIREFQSQLPG